MVVSQGYVALGRRRTLHATLRKDDGKLTIGMAR